MHPRTAPTYAHELSIAVEEIRKHGSEQHYKPGVISAYEYWKEALFSDGGFDSCGYCGKLGRRDVVSLTRRARQIDDGASGRRGGLRATVKDVDHD
jgi:hypothetical protein